MSMKVLREFESLPLRFFMGNIKKIADTYYIEFYARGLMYSKIAGPDEAEALKLLEETERTIIAGEMLTVVREITIAVFFEEFLSYAHQAYSVPTHKRFRDLVSHFNGFLKTTHPVLKDLSQLTPNIFEDYKNIWIKNSSPHKINFTILLLREIMEYGIKTGFINDNPTIHVSLLPWSIRSYKKTYRSDLAKELLSRSVPIGKVIKLLKLNDVARIMYFSNLIPLKREEMYS